LKSSPFSCFQTQIRSDSTNVVPLWLSFAFDFVTEPLLEFGTGLTEAIDLFTPTALFET